MNGILQHWPEVVFLGHDAVPGNTKKEKKIQDSIFDNIIFKDRVKTLLA